LFSGTWDSATTIYPYLLSAFQRMLGASVRSGRLASVMVGTLTVPLVALCAREMGISWIGSLAASGFLAVSHWHAHFSRMTLPAVVTAFFLLVAIYTLMLAYRREQWWLYALAGAACGFAPYWFLSNRVLFPLLAAWLAYFLLFDRAWLRRHASKIALFTVVLAAVACPLILSWISDTARFMAPERHVGVMYNLSYWGSQHPGQSIAMWNVLWNQLRPSLGLFVVSGGPYAPWGGTYAPALDILTGALLFPAVMYALYRARNPLVALVLIWFGGIWFSGVVLTIDAPQMEHAVGAVAAIFLLIAYLVDAVGCVLNRVFRHSAPYAALAIIMLVVSGVLNYYAYFQVWGPQLAGANGFAWQAYDAASYVGAHATPDGTAIYANGYPDEFFKFLAPHAIEFPGSVKAFKPASLYIVFAGDPVTPGQLAARVPGSRVEPDYDTDGDLAFTAILPPTPN
jgi:hypothetical protein